MCSLTMGDKVRFYSRVANYTWIDNLKAFVLLEDPIAPTRADIMDQVDAQPTAESPTFGANVNAIRVPHHRNSYITVQPSGALEQLLGQLRARWTSTRSSANVNVGVSQRGAQQSGNQLTIEGFVFGIGSDWLVRVGNVILGSGGTVKGMLLEV